MKTEGVMFHVLLTADYGQLQAARSLTCEYHNIWLGFAHLIPMRRRDEHNQVVVLMTVAVFS
jgi:hypothetical protein